MKLNITLSINKRQEAQHNTFLLRWDPATSLYPASRLDRDMRDWAKDCWEERFAWHLFEELDIKKGDRFFMLRSGEGNTGLFAAGRFLSDAVPVGEESECYRTHLEFEAIFHPERTEIIPTEELADELPHLDWPGRESGERLEKEDAVRLELLWRDFVGRNKSLYLPRAVKNEAYDSRSDIDRAVALASKAHAADYDLDGNPTILHPLAVGMMGTNDTERIVGFLHDVVEDTRYDFDDLAKEGFSGAVLEALRLLTHDKQTPYMAYIERICKSGNTTALRVKMNDLKHNLARGREGGHTHCVERHTEALAFIEAHLAATECHKVP